jgi:hypothetical protein
LEKGAGASVRKGPLIANVHELSTGVSAESCPVAICRPRGDLLAMGRSVGHGSDLSAMEKVEYSFARASGHMKQA